MTHRNLKTSVREHIEQQSLSKQQLSELMAMQEQQPDVMKPPKLFRRYAIAASFAAILVLSGLLFYNSQIPRGNLNERIGAEVAQNHIKLKPLEVHTGDMQSIRRYFTELDFSPVQSRLLADNNTTLLGGRYCSIQGVTAAQLRVKDNATGEVHSLYQTAYDEDTFAGLPKLESGGKPVTVYAKGIGVQIWVEKDVLFAITKDEK